MRLKHPTVRWMVAIAMVLALLMIYVVVPMMRYGEGTARNVTTLLIKSPYNESPHLEYAWGGEVFRSCPVEIRRRFIDSGDAIKFLAPQVFDPIPQTMLGRLTYYPKIQVPADMAEGPAIYQAYEISQCNWIERMFPRAVPYPPVEFFVTR